MGWVEQTPQRLVNLVSTRGLKETGKIQGTHKYEDTL